MLQELLFRPNIAARKSPTVYAALHEAIGRCGTIRFSGIGKFSGSIHYCKLLKVPNTLSDFNSVNWKGIK